MNTKHYAIKIRALAVDCLNDNEMADVAEGVIVNMLTEFESNKVKELQTKLDAICEYADKSSYDDVSEKACDIICDIAHGETE